MQLIRLLSPKLGQKNSKNKTEKPSSLQAQQSSKIACLMEPKY